MIFFTCRAELYSAAAVLTCITILASKFLSTHGFEYLEHDFYRLEVVIATGQHRMRQHQHGLGQQRQQGPSADGLEITRGVVHASPRDASEGRQQK